MSDAAFGRPAVNRGGRSDRQSTFAVDAATRIRDLRTMTIKQLSKDQLANFDTEYVTEALWNVLKRHIDSAHPDGHFSFLDIGGGNGVFADRLLANYPDAEGTVLDNSELLLGRNQPHPRKRLIEQSAENLDRIEATYDVVFFNWVLHHLVGDSYTNSVGHAATTLGNAASILKPGGHISIFENMYDGLIVDNAPSHIIHGLTSTRAITSIIRRLGANTAGTGVCFQSRASWDRILHDAGIATIEYAEDTPWQIPLTWRVFLHVGGIRCANMWTRPAASGDFASA